MRFKMLSVMFSVPKLSETCLNKQARSRGQKPFRINGWLEEVWIDGPGL
jgi:hypothetical protein